MAAMYPRLVGGVIQGGDRSGAFVIDARLNALITTTWRGTLTPSLVHACFNHIEELLEEQRARGVEVVQVVDSVKADRPDALTRRAGAERLDRLGEHFSDVALLPWHIVIGGSPVLAATLRAVTWLSRKHNVYQLYDKVDDALVAACAQINLDNVDPYRAPWKEEANHAQL